jgi:hypothetical protein
MDSWLVLCFIYTHDLVVLFASWPSRSNVLQDIDSFGIIFISCLCIIVLLTSVSLILFCSILNANLQVYASMSPIVHVVNVGSAATESVANITVCATNNSLVLLSVPIRPPPPPPPPPLLLLSELVLFECLMISLLAHLQSVASHLKAPFNLQEIHDGLDFSVDDSDDEFGIFSVKFSNDGRELVAASSNNSIYVYDLEARKLSLQIPAHMV